MQDKSTIVVLALCAMFVFATAIAYFYANNDQSVRAAHTDLDKLAYRAKPGTQRENARALTRPGERNTTGGESEAETDVWGKFDGPDDESDHVSRNDGTFQVARSEPDGKHSSSGPAAQAENEMAVVFQERLDALTEGLLRGDLSEAEMERRYQDALDAAASRDQKYLAACYYARVWLTAGNYRKLLEVTSDAPIQERDVTPETMELLLMKGMAQESLGDADGAIVSYGDVLERIVLRGESSNQELTNVYRQAALRQTRLYRELGQHDQADHVVRHARIWLSRG